MLTSPRTMSLLRVVPTLFILTVMVLSACTMPGVETVSPNDVAYAERWWNVLSAEQMVAALYGDTATEDQAAAAQKMYADLDDSTKAKVNAAAGEIIYAKGGYTNVAEWWETLDCRLMRIAAGDGNEADPMSPYCAHYPGSGAAKLLGPDELEHVNLVGMALLGRDEPGVYPADVDYAERWWNVLNAEQMVAALYGDTATEDQAAAAQKMYAELDPETKRKVNYAAYVINGADEHESVGAWWETLDCRLMRIAAGDGNEADPTSEYCRHYPGSDFPPEKILSADALAHVNKVGMALLGRDYPGTYLDPPEWLYGTYESCSFPEGSAVWEFSKHSVRRTRSGYVEDYVESQSAILEERGSTWYKITLSSYTYVDGNRVNVWHQFDMADDESSQIIRTDAWNPGVDFPLCPVESQ